MCRVAAMLVARSSGRHRVRFRRFGPKARIAFLISVDVVQTGSLAVHMDRQIVNHNATGMGPADQYRTAGPVASITACTSSANVSKSCSARVRVVCQVP